MGGYHIMKITKKRLERIEAAIKRVKKYPDSDYRGMPTEELEKLSMEGIPE